MNLSTAIRRQSLFWFLVFGLWFLLVLAFAGQLVFVRNEGWLDAFSIAMRDWFPWLFLAPAAGWLAFQFPLERNRLFLSIPVHVLGCLLVVIIYEVFAPLPLDLRRAGDRAFDQPQPGPDRIFQPGDSAGQDFGPEGPPRRPFPPPPGERFRRPPGAMPLGPESPLPPGRATPTERFINRTIMHARFNLPIYWVIVSLAHALTFYRRSEERERQAAELEARLNTAKLDALRMQLQPHFLFNTLNAISTLVHKDAQAADEMIGNLSELLRASLQTTQQEIPLRDELQLLDRYLDIQQVRFGDHLRIEKDIDTAALDCPVPTLVLQPLVENSIRHGIEPQLQQGRILIEAKRENNLLKLTVRDNGNGVATKKSNEGHGGVGLSNTRARLQQLYGSAAKLILKTGSEAGCSVEIEIPVRS